MPESREGVKQNILQQWPRWGPRRGAQRHVALHTTKMRHDTQSEIEIQINSRTTEQGGRSERAEAAFYSSLGRYLPYQNYRSMLWRAVIDRQEFSSIYIR